MLPLLSMVKARARRWRHVPAVLEFGFGPLTSRLVLKRAVLEGRVQCSKCLLRPELESSSESL
jgi:hypothetical protein